MMIALGASLVSLTVAANVTVSIFRRVLMVVQRIAAPVAGE